MSTSLIILLPILGYVVGWMLVIRYCLHHWYVKSSNILGNRQLTSEDYAGATFVGFFWPVVVPCVAIGLIACWIGKEIIFPLILPRVVKQDRLKKKREKEREAAIEAAKEFNLPNPQEAGEEEEKPVRPNYDAMRQLQRECCAAMREAAKRLSDEIPEHWADYKSEYRSYYTYHPKVKRTPKRSR